MKGGYGEKYIVNNEKEHIDFTLLRSIPYNENEWAKNSEGNIIIVFNGEVVTNKDPNKDPENKNGY